MITIRCFSCGERGEYYLFNDFCHNCGKRIFDPLIKELVFALNHIGIETFSSCEGHNGEPEPAFPWVSITRERDLPRLQRLIDRYNETVEGLSTWGVGYSNQELRWYIYPRSHDKRLEALQTEANILARFILARTKGK